MSLKGKFALITGSASGIGLATAKVFLNEGIKGITLLDIQESSEIKSLLELHPNEIQYINADVSSEEQVRSAFKQALATFKALDIVVHSAGILNDRAWRRTFEINVNGAVIVNLVSLDVLGKNKGGNGGTVINISSEAALGINTNIVPLYATSKLTSLGLSRNFGKKIFKTNTGVSVIAVCPGYTRSNLGVNNHQDIFLQHDFIYDSLKKSSGSLLPQSAESVGKCVMKAILDDESGSIWFCDKDLPGHKVKLSVEHLET